jgi:hypothetical protein
MLSRPQRRIMAPSPLSERMPKRTVSKYLRGFRRFQRRGRSAVRSEWRLQAAVHNLLKLHSHWISPAVTCPRAGRAPTRPEFSPMPHGPGRRRNLCPTATAMSRCDPRARARPALGRARVSLWGSRAAPSTETYRRACLAGTRRSPQCLAAALPAGRGRADGSLCGTISGLYA